MGTGTAKCPDVVLQARVLTAGARIAHRSGGGCSCRMGLQWEMLKDQTVKRFEGGPSQEET